MECLKAQFHHKKILRAEQTSGAEVNYENNKEFFYGTKVLRSIALQSLCF